MKNQSSRVIPWNYKCLQFNLVDKCELYEFIIDVLYSKKPTKRWLTKLQIYQLIFNYLEKSCQSQFSTAILNENGKIVCAEAILKWDDFIQIEPLKHHSMKLKIEEEWLRECNKLYQPKQENCERTLVLFLAATSPQQSGNLFRALNQKIIETAQNQGYKEIILDCLGPFNKRIFEKGKFENKGTLLYSQFKFYNRRPYQHLKKIKGVTRYSLDLDVI